MRVNQCSLIFIYAWLFGYATLWPLSTVFSATAPESGVYTLPMNCNELLPDAGIFISFFESVGKGRVILDRTFAKRIFRILYLREKLADAAGRYRDKNPVDFLLRRTLCFYREQKEPLKPVTYDDAQFVAFLKSSLKELESKVDDAVFQWEFEKQQREHYERRLERDQQTIHTVQREAEVEARRAYERLATHARHKTEHP